MIRFFYSLLVYFILPFTVIKLIYRSFRQPDYLKHWSERSGFYSASTKKIWGKRKTLWIHAVSVGETKAAIPVIKLFLKKYPHSYMALNSIGAEYMKQKEYRLSEKYYNQSILCFGSNTRCHNHN
jgi:3-deoxy-D-manno-octulosonic-acid transferase